MKLVAKPAGRPRGIALSPNGRILYVSNADEHNIRAYDVDHNGDTSNERVLVSGIDGVPGGMSVDEKGNLYVAAKGIAVYSPEGRPIRVIGMKELPSSCAFGEADSKSFFITARGVVYRVRLDVQGAGVY
jgi:gluconolactonase